MKRLIICVLMLAVLLTACTSKVFSPEDFKVINSENFVVYHAPGHERAAKDVLRVLEESHDRVINNLRPDKDGPFTVRIYPNLKAFHKGINRPDAPVWVIGNTSSGREFSLVSPQYRRVDYDTMLQVAVHEFTHCVTLRLIGGRDVQLMLWLVEGIALYEAGQFVNPAELPYMQSRDTLPRFLEMRQETAELYNLGYVIVEYIVEGWGMETVRSLLVFQGRVSYLGMTDEEFYDGFYEFVRERYLQ